MTDWTLRPTWEDRLKDILVPPRLYYWLRAHRERCRGEREIALLPFLVDPDRAAVDVGANKGVYTYWLEHRATHVHAYEPNPKMFAVLQKSVGNSPKVTLRHIAASDQAGEAVLHIPRGSRGFSNQGGSLKLSKRQREPEREHAEVRVEAKRLDDENLSNIGFMKIDVEGFEFEVLAGAELIIQRDHPVLLIEMEERHSGISNAEGVARVEALGYDAFFLTGKGVLTSFARYAPPKPGEAYINNFIFLPKG